MASSGAAQPSQQAPASPEFDVPEVGIEAESTEVGRKGRRMNGGEKAANSVVAFGRRLCVRG